MSIEILLNPQNILTAVYIAVTIAGTTLSSYIGYLTNGKSEGEAFNRGKFLSAYMRTIYINILASIPLAMKFGFSIEGFLFAFFAIGMGLDLTIQAGSKLGQKNVKTNGTSLPPPTT